MRTLDTKSVVLGALVALALIAVSTSQLSKAQTVPPILGAVVATCGSGVTYAANTLQPITVGTTGVLCVNQ